MLKEICIQTKSKNEFIELNSKLNEILKESGVKEGIMVVFTSHTTAGITINENADPDVNSDLLMKLEKICSDSEFKHSEGNSDAHLKSSLIGASENIIIKQGELLLGTWQGIRFCEFDGPRNRKVFVKIIEG